MSKKIKIIKGNAVQEVSANNVNKDGSLSINLIREGWARLEPVKKETKKAAPKEDAKK